ncbi:D-alanyl-D-alanine carboxypeptidase/D-alanyl-D-alanine endopeptidase [Thauera sinica]|uniref:D-alanyl-D-alanine carboxypeptidase/D-alanyl-D-alanine-endopeptidase n=1 Tax=Thauera sinica TaxID=2665146 RepID=A0ABW1ASZ2_9RHOO|nr:D-alanyl-D-alanine carboxypeptidase/D-alanyl-D-alanine-endopeptidase [Thauera sp. K11]ATE62726.1 D-alanyl-D-alanine carboxypeptidase/D-alanyl-D-alanine-endopeptidase [Thauera sp. K11]
MLACTALLATADTLPPTVRLALEQARVPAEAVSIWVQPVDGGRPALAFNAAQPMNPASVMKLVTAFATLDRLGPAHVWTTRIASTGKVHDGILDGDLYIVGGADPMLGYDRLWKMLRRVQALGIHTVRGDIVLDGSALSLPPHDPGAFDGRGLRPYNSGPYGLLLNWNTLQLALTPAARTGEAVAVAAEQPLSGMAIDNRLVTSDAPCTVWYRDLDARLDPGPRLVLAGSLPASCGPRNWSAAPLAPADYGTALVAGLWREMGGALRGRVRPGTAPADAEVRLTEDSPPLADVVRDMNKWSSNVIARQLLATLGATAAAAPAADMVAGGARVAADVLAAAGIDTSGLVIENGSGLSRIERIAAASLGQLLATAWQRPWMPEYISALPVAGVDGTARKRLARSPASGQAHVKTGTLNGVRAIAGYLLDDTGHRHVVVMMINHPEAANTAAAQDALLEWVWAGGPGRAP